MALAFVKSAKGTSALATTSPAFATATTSGNLVVLGFASDDYNGTVSTGWTQSSEMEQQTFHGGYLWWCISTGQTTMPNYVIGSATSSSWVLAEFSGNDATPYDTSEGQFAQSSAFSSGVTYPGGGVQARTAMIISFKEAAGGGAATSRSYRRRGTRFFNRSFCFLPPAPKSLFLPPKPQLITPRNTQHGLLR
jgi:hypothetical protein